MNTIKTIPKIKNELEKPRIFTRLCLALVALMLACFASRAQTTNYYCDGFENLTLSLDDWTISSGTWEIGIPTFGPPTNSLGRRAFAGTNCAATVLAGNYAENTSSRLESKPFVVPATNQNPRLRFWHWFNFNCGDYGRVQIKVGAGSWVALANPLLHSSTFSGYSGGIWSYPSFNLSAYAGQTVQVGFFFSSTSSGCGTTVGPGWYIDEVCVLTGPLAMLTPNVVEGFEATNFWSTWSADNGTWEWGVPTSGPPTKLGRRAHEGSNVIATILGGNYGENTSSRLVSPLLTVPTASGNPRLRFWHWYSFDCGDSGQVQIKGTNGVWQALDGFSGYSGGIWSYPCYDLSAYAGQTVQFGFYFFSTSSGCGTTVDTGWYIDELLVVTGAVERLVVNQVETFEGTNFWANWCLENGTWEWGVPTSGPPTNALGRRAHQGSNVIATILSGTYGENTSSRLVSPPLDVPAANQNPRLRFWHWYSFNCGDYGQMQVKGTNGVWQAVDGFSGYSGGIWSYPSYDLSAYAGQTVQFGFYFFSTSSGCGGTVDNGWYIDELVVVTGATALSNPENFEQTNFTNFWSNWSSENGTWEWGVPTSGPGAAHEGSNVVATILAGNYGENTSSRLVSPAFVVPPAATNPRLRFWQWFNFNCGDNGQIQIMAGAGNWQPLATYSGNSGGVWSRPNFDLSAYAGQTVKIGFNFFSTSSGCGTTVAPGWYIDELRLLHDFALLLSGSPILRTQDMACVSLGIAASSPVSTVNFTLQAPSGHLGGVMLNTEGCWTGTLTPLSDAQWLVSLQNSCMSAAMGVETAGSICFSAISTHSAFVPLAVSSLMVTNVDGSSPPAHEFGSRAVIIANEPLLEATLGTNKRRLLTLYGKANTAYEIRYATNVSAASPWTLGFTNTVPASLFYSQVLQGTYSNAPVLFLRANEQ